MIKWDGLRVALATGAPASPVLNGHAALSQSHAATPALYGTSAFFQLGSPSDTIPVVRYPGDTLLSVTVGYSFVYVLVQKV